MLKNISLLNKTLLAVILLLGFLIYLPTLSYFPEGDDFLFLWHIRVPVSFWELPFHGWEEPIAGRFGYGQAWYGALIYRIFGFQPEVFNFFGIICRLIATFTIYKFCSNLTNKKTIGLLAAFIFTILSTGIDGEVYLFLHFSMLFLSLFLFGSYKFIQGIEEKSVSKVSFGTTLLLLGNYFYTIRAIGITLLPLWSLLRIRALNSTKLRISSLTLAIIIVVISALMVTNFIPGANSYATTTLIGNSAVLLNAVSNGKFESIRTFLVSLGLMLFPREFYNLVSDPFKVDFRPNRYLLFWSPVIWTLIYWVFSLPTILSKNKKAILVACLGYLSIMFWSFGLYFLRKSGITFYNGGELSVVTFGITIYLLSFWLGLQLLFKNSKLGFLILAGVSASILFFIPNWLHGPDIISSTESRYFTVSSGFIAIVFSALIYHLFIFGEKLYNSKSHKSLGVMYLAFSLVIISTITFVHLNNATRIISLNKSIRNPEIIKDHWATVKSKVDFTKKPLIVVVWSGAQIDNAKREFFRHQSLGVVGNMPWDYNLTDQVKLFYSYQESADAICGWQKRGIIFDFNNFYEFNLDSQRRIIDRTQLGRSRIRTWDGYCQDTTKKGIEVSD